MKDEVVGEKKRVDDPFIYFSLCFFEGLVVGTRSPRDEAGRFFSVSDDSECGTSGESVSKEGLEVWASVGESGGRG